MSLRMTAFTAAIYCEVPFLTNKEQQCIDHEWSTLHFLLVNKTRFFDGSYSTKELEINTYKYTT